MNAWAALVLLALSGVEGALPQEKPQDSYRQLEAADDLQVRLFASEPQLFNPACIDVDERGRVWVAEAVNYRRAAGPKSSAPPFFRDPARKTGDRIVILEDTNGDGVSDRSRVFYQGLDLQAPLGIAVIGNKLWVSQAPDLFTIDIRSDTTAGRKEVVATGFGGLNGDHSLHSSYMGADGKLYHCIGDGGGDVKFPDGRRLTTDGKPWIGGTVVRTNPDLTGLEVLAHNFRNQVECATDSFGNTFTSDNDHDGYQWVRFVHVLDGGDYGWSGPKGSHWRMEYPGVVPGLLRTGAGSPAGMCVYEGTLLPEKYRGMPIHADAVGVVQCFRLARDGASFRIPGGPEGPQTLETLSQIRKADVLLASKDRWFRPSDVAVAPDGSLFVADWYDPVVGGGGMGDASSGRVYRILPKGHDGKYRIPAYDVGSPEQLVAALRSPCISLRARAIYRVWRYGEEAVPILAPHAKAEDRVLRARVLSMLATLGPDGQKHVRRALQDPDPDFRVLALRLLRQNATDILEVSKPLLRDPSAHVRREILLALRDADPAAARESLVTLALQYDGRDRWYLEAVGIAFRGREEVLVPPLLKALEGAWDSRVPGLLWALRHPEGVSRVGAVLHDPARPLEARLQAAEALGTFLEPAAGEQLIRLLAPGTPRELAARAVELLVRRLPGPWKTLVDRPELRAAVEGLEDGRRLGVLLGTRPLLRWRISPSMANPNCEAFTKPHPVETAAEPERLEGWTGALVSSDGRVDLRAQRTPHEASLAHGACVVEAKEPLETRLLVGSDDALQVWVNGKRVHDRHDHRFLTARDEAIPVRFEAGLNRILVKVENKRGNWAFIVEVEDPGRKLTEVTGRDLPRLEASGERIDPKSPPPAADVLRLTGDPGRGREVFFRSRADCGRCHRVRGEGGETGPELSAIGTKLGKEGLLLSILKPSEAVAPEFTQWVVRTSADDVVTGVIVEDTKDRLVLRDAEGKAIALAARHVADRKKSDLSPMPEALVGELSKQDLADLVQFLSELR